MSDSKKEQVQHQTVEALMKAFTCWPKRSWAKAALPMDCRKGEARTLILLQHDFQGQGLTVSELSKKMQVTSPFVTQLLNTLEEDQLIYRQEDPKDRRIVRIFLTELGKQQAIDMQKRFYDWFYSLAEHLGEADSCQLSHLLHKVFDFMHESKLNSPK